MNQSDRFFFRPSSSGRLEAVGKLHLLELFPHSSPESAPDFLLFRTMVDFFGDPPALDLTTGLFFGNGCEGLARRGGVTGRGRLPASGFSFPLFSPYDIRPCLALYVDKPSVHHVPNVPRGILRVRLCVTCAAIGPLSLFGRIWSFLDWALRRFCVDLSCFWAWITSLSWTLILLPLHLSGGGSAGTPYVLSGWVSFGLRHAWHVPPCFLRDLPRFLCDVGRLGHRYQFGTSSRLLSAVWRHHCQRPHNCLSRRSLMPIPICAGGGTSSGASVGNR